MHLSLRTSMHMQPALQQRAPAKCTARNNISKRCDMYTCQASRRDALLGGATGVVVGGWLQDQAAAGASVLAPLRKSSFSSAAGADAGDILTAQWFNAVCRAFGAPKRTAQVYQPPAPLGTTNPQVFNFFNSLPSLGVVGGTSGESAATGYKQFFAEYRGMVESLRSKDKTADAAFQAALGNKKADWKTYNTKLNYKEWLKENPDGNQLQFFDDWATYNLNNPGEAKRAYKAVLNDPVNRALEALDSDYPQSKPNFEIIDGTAYAKFTPVFEDIKTALSGAGKVSLSFDSSEESTDITDTWAQGSVGVKWRFFSGAADAQYSKLVEKISKNRITVEGSFEQGTPIAPEGISPGGWYDSAIITYAMNDDTAWKNRDTKASYFGPKGSLRWVNKDVYVVSGNCDFKITYHTELAADEQVAIRSQVQGGVWPFFNFNTSGGMKTNLLQSDSKTFVVAVTGTLPGPTVIAKRIEDLA